MILSSSRITRKIRFEEKIQEILNFEISKFPPINLRNSIKPKSQAYLTQSTDITAQKLGKISKPIFLETKYISLTNFSYLRYHVTIYIQYPWYIPTSPYHFTKLYQNHLLSKMATSSNS